MLHATIKLPTSALFHQDRQTRRERQPNTIMATRKLKKDNDPHLATLPPIRVKENGEKNKHFLDSI